MRHVGAMDLQRRKGPRCYRGPSFYEIMIEPLDQRHQLKRQTRDDVTVWMNFSDCTNSVPVTPPRIALSFLLNVLNRYSVFQYRPGSQSNLYSYPPPRNQPVYLRSARDGPIAPVLRL